ncbi:MAG: TetR/AcrR family transcriptional regulator [Gammaproteobacteria bacterium]|jgi:AcrR family transcriptional regulator
MSANSATDAAKNGRRMQRRSIDTRRRLIEAAVAAFAEHGYAGAATRDIAERAGVHHPLITYHFRNKERLWRAAADRLFGELNERLERTTGGPDARDDRERLTRAIRMLTLYSAEHPEWQHFLRETAAAGGDRAEWLTHRHLGRLFGVLVPLLESLQARGFLVAGDPAQICLALLGAAGGTSSLGPVYAGLTGRDVVEGRNSADYADLLVRLVLRGPDAG